jgi:ubiquinone/menaquinone biosynthesis C-methylase UbiE
MVSGREVCVRQMNECGRLKMRPDAMKVRTRRWRRCYYDVFSHVYDRFIQLHASKEDAGTRSFLVDGAALEPVERPRVLDVCCGTGAVPLAYAGRHFEATLVGCDFSYGMLRAARRKDPSDAVIWIQGNAACLPFADNRFHAVSCSHALYELKGEDRAKALHEMKRVVRSDGVVLIMEHEAPARPLAKFMFRLRLMAMGSADAKEFVESGLKPFQQIFPSVTVHHTPSGRSKLFCCRKQITRL